ncbi:TPA: hypothetical protein DIC20_02140 [Candidatus Dependentiae bacterium]|nr:MAG: hypothetical protein US03_C0006G0012 [candidate division TM6 bacterium GW2011_GWF2_36_131]KKQ03056.1 MAG: hypothetical protein US13_C0006G0012 [candidate division TM6 bacterium GW2011_GWE2_36_25]KKQ19623.1 MAG: hypothetical protein US32_C0007G0076 [candidate division TM6 bacterium GW2011_GWA2_36_9]HBR71138.1 hypothetical protein [Candidatus Dependentiae bacterium]HCU00485.1 hypothetical protein [Candidatus Dependentiae bacterium]
MNYKGHIIGGVVTYVLILYLLKFINYPFDTIHNVQWFLLCILGSLFPDIDTKSKIQLWIYRLLFIFYILLIINNPNIQIMIFTSILAIIPLIVRHRGLFHQPSFLIGLPLIIVCIISFIQPAKASEALINALFFIAGALSHLLLDKSRRT